MSFTLRGYQQKVVNAGINYFNSKSTNKSIIVAPVAAGKSICIAEIAKSLTGNTIVFQPRKELLEQNVNKIMSYGVIPSICSASFNKFESGKLTYATIGTAVNRLELFNGEWNVIIDEAHMMSPESDGMFNRFFKHIKTKKVLGLTATPFRIKRDSDGVHLKMINRIRPKVFNEIIHTVQISELKDEYWSDIKYEVYNDTINDILDKDIGNKNDYDDDVIDRVYRQYNILEETVIKTEELISEGRSNIIIFVKSLSHAEEYRERIPNSEVVSSKHSKKHNDRVINDFKEGKIKVLINCEKLTTGFDSPNIDALIQCRPTRSFILYYQIIGRAVRLHPEEKDCVIVDMVGNYGRFGDIRNLRIGVDKDGKDVAYMGNELITNKPYDSSKYNKSGNKGATTRSISKGKLKMPFGKYKNKTLDCVCKDINYLAWVYNNVNNVRTEKSKEAVAYLKSQYINHLANTYKKYKR